MCKSCKYKWKIDGKKCISHQSGGIAINVGVKANIQKQMMLVKRLYS